MGCCGSKSHSDKSEITKGPLRFSGAQTDGEAPIYPFMGFDAQGKPIILPPITMNEARAGKMAATEQQEEALRVMDLKSAPPPAMVGKKRFRWPSRKMIGNLLTVEEDQHLDQIISEESIHVASDTPKEAAGAGTARETTPPPEKEEAVEVMREQLRSRGVVSSP